MTIYYAHHVWKYNTEIENYELEIIKKHFLNPDIINPNGMVDQSMTECQIMSECLKLVSCSDVLVFSSISGVVGKGVVDEVKQAQVKNVKVYYLSNNKLKAFKGMFTTIPNSTTKRIYAVVFE